MAKPSSRHSTGRGTVSFELRTGAGLLLCSQKLRQADAAQQVLEARVKCKLLFQLRVFGFGLVQDGGCRDRRLSGVEEAASLGWEKPETVGVPQLLDIADQNDVTVHGPACQNQLFAVARPGEIKD